MSIFVAVFGRIKTALTFGRIIVVWIPCDVIGTWLRIFVA